MKNGYMKGIDTVLLINQLKRHEGLRLKPYRCTSGKITIGYGRNLEDIGITKDEAEYLLNNDIKKIQEQLAIYEWYCKLSSVRKSVIINMAFNIGIAGIFKFKNMLSFLEAENFRQAALEMLDSVWAVQVGERSKELAYQMEYNHFQFDT